MNEPREFWQLKNEHGDILSVRGHSIQCDKDVMFDVISFKSYETQSAALKIAVDALEKILSYQCHLNEIVTNQTPFCGQMVYQDHANEALSKIKETLGEK